MNFFRHFTVKKTMLPLLAERLSCLYIQWFAYKYAICEKGLWVLVALECCCLPGKLQKQGKFVASFVDKIDEIPAIFFKLGRLARS